MGREQPGEMARVFVHVCIIGAFLSMADRVGLTKYTVNLLG